MKNRLMLSLQNNIQGSIEEVVKVSPYCALYEKKVIIFNEISEFLLILFSQKYINKALFKCLFYKLAADRIRLG